MRETVFHTKLFDSTQKSIISDLNSSFSTSNCDRFKGKITKTTTGQQKILKLNFTWIATLRPPVGFFLETIQVPLDSEIPTGNKFKIFQHGYQSWSLSTTYSSLEKDISPKFDFLRYSQENVYAKHSGEVGDFISEGFTCLYSPSSDSGIIVGVSKLADPGVRIQTILNTDGEIEELTAILDYQSSPELKTNEKISAPELIIFSFKGSPEKALQKYYETLVATINIPELSKRTPTGWCSWYYYGTKISEKIILNNLKECKAKKLPIQFFQIDDGYQTTIGDWLSPNDKFPAGMKIIADEIRREGYQPGIWLAPFLVKKDSEFFKMYPEAVLKDEKGNLVPALWNPNWGKDYTYCLDLTHPKSIEFLTHLFKTIHKEWGYSYLKLDFLYAGLLPGQSYDPTLTPQVRYQNILKMIRKIVGKETFLLGCGAPILPSIGYFQGMRVSCDVAPFWKPETSRRLAQDKHALCTENALTNDITRSSMHRIFWFNDPDCLIVRRKKNSMNYNQTIFMASVLGISGGMLFVSEDMSKLEEARYNLLDKTLELSKLCQSKTPLPLGIFEGSFPEGMYNPSGYLGVWNPSKKRKLIEIKIPVSPKNLEWKDYWTGEIEPTASWDSDSNLLTLELPGYESRVFFIK